MDSDFVVGINKSIDAAKGETGKTYPAYLHNTLVTEKLDELAEAITEGGGGASSVEDLEDVDINNPQGGQCFKYNAETGKWTNGDDAGNVQSDWNENDPTSGAYILNKPTIPAAQVQADWNESDSSDPSYIQNKPTIPDAQVQANWNESDTTSKAYIQNKPTIPDAQVQSNWNESDTTSKAYIQNKPSIPSALSDLSDVDLTNVQNGMTLKYNSGTLKFEAGVFYIEILQADYDQLSSAQKHNGIPYFITDGHGAASLPQYVDLVDILTAGSTTLTIQSPYITMSGTYDIYTDPEIPHDPVVVTTGQIVITFSAQSTDVAVKVRVS